MKKYLKHAVLLIALLRRVNLFTFFRFYSRDSKNVVWIYRTSIYEFFRSSQIVTDAALIVSLLAVKRDFRIIYGKNIGSVHNSNILFNLSEQYNHFNVNNYVAILEHLSLQLENQGNNLLYNNWEIRFWENKLHMHDIFDKLNVSSPDSHRIMNEIPDIDKLPLEFPFLVKLPHSCSANGIFKCINFEDLVNVWNNLNSYERKEGIIIQKLIDMRRDLRVILVEDDVVLHYWRINNSSEWKPTSTGYGSTVDFENYPWEWDETIKHVFKKLDLTTGAFDITWDKDDLGTPPYFLEVSPAYMPNPVYTNKVIPYSSYKSSLRLFGSYESDYIDIVFKIKALHVRVFLDKSTIDDSKTNSN